MLLLFDEEVQWPRKLPSIFSKRVKTDEVNE